MSQPSLVLDRIRSEIIADPSNAWAVAATYQPIYAADAAARIAIVGQAPGRKAQESGVPWNDASGARLIEWLGVDEGTFRDPTRFALLPMAFYYPGKGSHGDLPPRADFAARWHPQILEAMPEIRLTLLIGMYAQRHYLQTRDSLTANVRRFADFLPTMLPLVHPRHSTSVGWRGTLGTTWRCCPGCASACKQRWLENCPPTPISVGGFT